MSSIERRESGTGTSWRVRYRAGGTQHVVTFASETAARRWQTTLEQAGPALALRILEEDHAPDIGTVADYVTRHIDRLTGVTEGTTRSYRSYLAHDMADIGAVPLSLLDRDAVARWVNRLAARGLAGKSIANRHGLLSAAMAGAVADRLIGENPCRGIRLPRTVPAEMCFLTRDEFAALHALLPARYQPLALLLVGTGMRLGEATALTVADVDLAARSARIRQAWKHTGTARRELGPPKTRRSTRTVPLQPQLVAALAPNVADRKPGEFVFLNAAGRPVAESSLWGRVWAPAVRQFAGDVVADGRVVEQGPGKHPRIHDLRHTFASWAIQAGVPLPTIQRTLGHESITTTIDRYGHLARSDFDALAAATAVYLPTTPAVTG